MKDACSMKRQRMWVEGWTLTWLALVGLTSTTPSKVQIVKDDEDFKDFKIEVLVDVSARSRGDVCSRKCGRGDKVMVHYERKLIERNGKLSQMLDSSYERKEPFDFRVGAGQVMPGLEAGVLGMCPGDKRRVHIPSKLTGGQEFKLRDDQRYVIEVELLESEAAPDVFSMIDVDADFQLTRQEVHDHLSAAAARRNSKPGVDGEPSIEGLVGEIFKAEDTDEDGVISHAEFSGPKTSRDEL